MLICAVESSARSVSVAILQDAQIIGESFVNTKQTHSETLMPMLEQLMRVTGTSVGEFNLFAAAAGPGSFTGVRIGVSCVKGLAFPFGVSCCGVSTLEAIAQAGTCLEGKTICAVMDARRNQVYNANFLIDNGRLVRLCADRAISIDMLYNELHHLGNNVVLFGDGAVLCYQTFQKCGAILAEEPIRLQRASSVARVAREMVEQGKALPPDRLVPIYLRPSQAERERQITEDK